MKTEFFKEVLISTCGKLNLQQNNTYILTIKILYIVIYIYNHKLIAYRQKETTSTPPGFKIKITGNVQKR